ncbi:ABC transporter ATP-binding protein [Rhodovulum sp. DZ06]|uniref:ABC transporter ATP-binding protein n=1 Tax=Rhodovulum sp. DZ06 TaxID=3425126 RepID=UPI003D326322
MTGAAAAHGTCAPGLRIEGTARTGGAPLFGPLSLHIPGGRWTCLLGPSGVGKSTLLRLIAGLPAHVDFDGAVEADDGAPLAGRTAWMSQADTLLPWASALDNVLIGARLRGEAPDRARARALLSRVGLSGFEARRPAALSGGQRQRVAIARTLMEDRPVVLLDEPFSALDARTRAEVQELAAETLSGRTVLLVTHDPAEAARMGDVIAVMEERGLEAIAPPPGAPPRAVDDAATLSMQGALLRRLREGAA